MARDIRIPAAIAPGSKVGVVSVAAPEATDFPDRFEAGLMRLEALGHELIIADHVRRSKGLRSEDPSQVARELTDLWMRPDVSAVLCAGGGITANSLLPHLNFDELASEPKFLVGASNPTVLLNALAGAGVVSLHGPSVIWDFGDPDQPQETRDCFVRVSRATSSVQLGTAPDWVVPGSARGPLLGGNLTSLLHLAGTKWMPSFDGAILVWEDIEEDAAHLAAKLMQLRLLGVLDRIAAVIVGELVDCEPTNGVDARTVVETELGGLGVPVGWGLPFGHTPLKYTLPIGGLVDLSHEGVLTWIR